MGMSEFDPAARERRAWNAGRKVGAKRALKPRKLECGGVKFRAKRDPTQHADSRVRSMTCAPFRRGHAWKRFHSDDDPGALLNDA
jgi:hypothetical protein